MAIKTIPLTQLATNPLAILSECADTGQPCVVELPDQRFVSIQALEPTDDDDLTSELLATNVAFQALVARAKSGHRKPFAARVSES